VTAQLAELADFVLEETGQPIDVWAVAATLESGGVRDIDARDRYGRREIFDLAEAVLAECRTRPLVESEVAPLRRRQVGRYARLYLRGGFFFVPLVMQFLSIVLLGYGLWASTAFSHRQASIVGCALIFSFLVTGAVVQVLGYVGPRFSEAGKHILAARATVVLFGVGVAFLAAGAALWALAGWLAHAWSARTLGAGLIYYALAGLLALTSGVLYMLRQFIVMAMATAAGIGVVGFVLHESSLGIYGAHWLGLGSVVAVELGWAAAVLTHRSGRTAAELAAATAPPIPLLVRAALPFAIYGFAYYAFLFTDRLFAWSAGSHDRPFTFRPAYEVGLDWALLAVTPALAYLEIAVHALAERLGGQGGLYALTHVVEHNRAYRRFYTRRLAMLGCLYAAGAALVFGAVRGASSVNGLHSVGHFFSDPTTVRVFAVGVIGYGLLVWGLYNSSYLFALGQPWWVLRALLPAVAVAVVVALVCSRTIGFWAASIGLAAGALVFALVSLYELRRLLARLDYYAFAAF
jgi:hypothetical protein